MHHSISKHLLLKASILAGLMFYAPYLNVSPNPTSQQMFGNFWARSLSLIFRFWSQMLTQELRTTLPRPWWRFKMPKRLLQHWHKLLQHFLGQPFGGSCSHLAERATQARNDLAILWQSWLACRVVVVYSDALQVCCVDTAGALTTWARRWSPLPLSSCLIFLFTCLGSLRASTHAVHVFFSF